jgi:hypothetical protein
MKGVECTHWARILEVVATGGRLRQRDRLS